MVIGLSNCTVVVSFTELFSGGLVYSGQLDQKFIIINDERVSNELLAKVVHLLRSPAYMVK